MVSTFRKNIKIRHLILWTVFGAMVMSYVGVLFFRVPGGNGGSVAFINGRALSAGDYKRSLGEIQASISAMQAYLPSNMSYETMVQLILGGKDLQTVALERSIKNELVNQVAESLDVQLDETFFKEELARMLPKGLFNEVGSLNMDTYDIYMSRLGVSTGEFESACYKDMLRSVVEKVVSVAEYNPSYILADKFKQKTVKKSFEVAVFDFQHFLKNENESAISETDLQAYFEKNKEKYKTEEKRCMRYFTLSPKQEEASIKLDTASIQNFYEKNKGTLFRIAPQVSIRRILISNEQGDVVAHKKAEDVLSMLTQDSSQFAALAKQYSHDKDSAKKGGLLELFSRGTHDAELEKAAFKLQNKGEISGIIQTARGYEIIQLEQRVSAVEKSLEEVREQIVKTLRAKKAAAAIKSDVETAMHAYKKQDKEAVSALADRYKAKSSQTPWLVNDKTKYEGIEAKLVERAFGKMSSTKNAGFFQHNGDYIVYELVEARESQIPSLSAIQKDVSRDFRNSRAHDDLNTVVKQAKAKLYRKEQGLKALAQDEHLKFVETGMISRSDKSDKLKEMGLLQSKLFVLSDASQILEYRHKDDVYLARFVDCKDLSDDDQQGYSDFIASEKKKVQTSGMNAFIASLQRNATIDVEKQVINAYKRN